MQVTLNYNYIQCKYPLKLNSAHNSPNSSPIETALSNLLKIHRSIEITIYSTLLPYKLTKIRHLTMDM